MVSSLHIIWNPVSGAGAGEKTFRLVSTILKAKDIPFSSAMTEYPGHASLLAEEAVASGAKRILMLSGDSTLREIAPSLIGTDVVLGIVPCGSGNDLARPLRLPSDPAAALDIALSDHIRKMDVGTANGKLFFNIAGVGFDVDVLVVTDELRAKGFTGSRAYMKALLKCISHLTPRKMTIITPERTITKNALILAAGNGTHFGGGLNITPGADPFDGKFNVCVIHDVSRLSVLYVLAKFLKGTHTATKYCTCFQTTELEVLCEPDSMMELDGTIMRGTPVTIKLLPGMLNLAVPEDI
ncbi:MAG: diacylglycerol kinase family lipid kinase [Clostridia bacterium]|nr:diacylglycerol kinase family lipid kinase [Clostridia bacterium]